MMKLFVRGGRSQLKQPWLITRRLCSIGNPQLWLALVPRSTRSERDMELEDGLTYNPDGSRATYLGPARSVPGGHLVFTDEGNLWYTTNVRQFDDHPKEPDDCEADTERPAAPYRRVRRKSSIVELAGGVGLIPGMHGERLDGRGEEAGISAISQLATASSSSSSEDVVSDDVVLEVMYPRSQLQFPRLMDNRVIWPLSISRKSASQWRTA